MNLKLTAEAAAALSGLRASADFAVFLKWLEEHKRQAMDVCCRQEGNALFRAQGSVQVLEGIEKAFTEAPSTLEKFQQQQRR